MTPKARNLVFLFVLIFMFLHHDFWLWDDRTLVFGFLPSGLAWHAGYSVACTVFWYLVMRYAWPSSIEDFAEGKTDVIAPPESDEGDSK